MRTFLVKYRDNGLLCEAEVKADEFYVNSSSLYGATPTIYFSREPTAAEIAATRSFGRTKIAEYSSFVSVVEIK